MGENDKKVIDRKAKAEVKKIKKLLQELNVKEEKISILNPIIENVAVMKVKLDEVKENVKEAELISEYNNGGGQSGTRENPLFKGYEALWKSYIAGMTKILDSIPGRRVVEDTATNEEKPKTMLEIVRARKQA